MASVFIENPRDIAEFSFPLLVRHRENTQGMRNFYNFQEQWLIKPQALSDKYFYSRKRTPKHNTFHLKEAGQTNHRWMSITFHKWNNVIFANLFQRFYFTCENRTKMPMTAQEEPLHPSTCRWNLNYSELDISANIPFQEIIMGNYRDQNLYNFNCANHWEATLETCTEHGKDCNLLQNKKLRAVTTYMQKSIHLQNRSFLQQEAKNPLPWPAEDHLPFKIKLQLFTN